MVLPSNIDQNLYVRVMERERIVGHRYYIERTRGGKKTPG